MLLIHSAPSHVRPAYNASPMHHVDWRRTGIPVWAAAAAIIGGSLVLAGWAFDIPVLKQPMPTASAMRAITAFAFVVSGVSLWLRARTRLTGTALALGILVAGIGLVSFDQVIMGQDFTIGQAALAAAPRPDHMSPLTAFCFLAFGLAMAASARAGRAWLAHSLALLGLFVATIVSIGYLYKVSNLVGIGTYTTMAPHTAVLLLVLGTGILFLEPSTGLMDVFTGDTLGGKMARRTLPATLGIPILLGWLRLEGEHAGLYDPRVGPPLVVVGTMVLISVVIWLNARVIARVDGQRLEFEEQLQRTNETLEDRVAEKTAELVESQARTRTTEDRLRTGQRMEALGQLAGGVAHDFNNMMTVVLGYSELLLNQVTPDHPSYKALDEIRKAGDRCANLTGHLLAFSRRQVLTPAVLDLGLIMADLGEMMPVLLGEHIAVTTTVAPDLWRVRADQAQIEQVIVNLVVNARDAMPRGGTLMIDVHNVTVDQPAAAVHPDMRHGSYVMITIADTGHGMDEETRARAFDPFFTTKPVGQGSGLGLSTAYGFIKQSGGYIHLDTEPNAGTTIQVYLPRVDASVTTSQITIARKPPRGKETVLLAEDEGSVRLLLASVLGQAGYQLLEAPNGQAALDMAATHAGPIDLLISDIVMPGLNGGELAARLAAVRPETKMLLISGYADNEIVDQAAAMRGTAFLRKPFTPAELLTRVREVCDEDNRG